ncbi:unnamed protein product [Thelazia callipaeda]|uniref:Uncharacterized protein n=1 Tax=Thelazia callipaeda TaxID=103827 RepID=A0A0N5CSH1_THECL|nr:unnamed protein product [Thelazia callipaeda]
MVLLIFLRGRLQTSHFLVKTKNEKKLYKKLLAWKKSINFQKNDQTFAFHFTTLEANEPENSEEIFREIFGIKPFALCLNGKQSSTGAYHYKMDWFRRRSGPVYVIVNMKVLTENF